MLADRGFFPEAELGDALPLPVAVRRSSDSQSAGHRDEYRGAWGTGCRFPSGMALAGKLDAAPYRVFTLLGDGELAEGSNWEAAMAAAHYRLDNLTAIVDHNTLADHRPHARRLQQRAARREVPQFRLGGATR